MTRYRDDDISKYTDINLITKIHSLFIKYNKIHTVTLEMSGLWDNKVIWYWLMTTPNLDIGLHGWEHKDYSQLDYSEIYFDLKSSLNYWNFNIARGKYEPKTIKVFYPPWNKTSENLERVCRDLGLEVDNREGGEVYNLHWWAFIDEDRFTRLEKCLK